MARHHQYEHLYIVRHLTDDEKMCAPLCVSVFMNDDVTL